MFNFVKNIFSTLFGILFFFIFIIFIVFFFIFLVAIKPDESEIKPNSVLHIVLKGKIVERSSEFYIPFESFININNKSHLIGLSEIKNSVKSAKLDEKISGIYLEIGNLDTGWAKLEEIRDILMDFKISGKFIISYSEFYTQKAYYIASLSDEIILHPDGMFIFNGFSKTVIFYRSFFKGVGIKPVIFRIGKYKSATEPFLYNFMSKFSKLQDSLLLFSFYNHFINEISDNRSIDINYLKNISKSLLISTAEDAYKFKFVTKIGYFDEVKLILMNNFSVDHLVEYISLNDYSNYIKFRNFNLSKNKVVILIAEGDIIDGKSSSYSVGSRDFVNVIKKIREDDSIKALVLRINSPGGSSIASENIWRSLMLTKNRKPVIASMSDIAASGGYYLAMACDYIIAYPTTITGSIGIFWIWMDYSDFLQNKLGIMFDVVKTGISSDLFTNPGRSINFYEKKVIKKIVKNSYNKFLEKVSLQRKLSMNSILRVSEGRVWSGILAKKYGLVDKLGNLDDAIEIAASSAFLGKDYKVEYWTTKKTFFQLFFSNLNSYFFNSFFNEKFFYFLNIFREYVFLNGIQYRLLYDISID